MGRFFYILSVSLFLGYCLCQTNDLDVDDIEKKLKENIPELESIPELENFNKSSLPTEEDLDRLLKEKCEKNGGGEAAYNALKNQQSELQTCLEAQLNATEIQLEIEESKKTGSMDEVFGKYCKKYPALLACVESLTDKVKACLNPAEQKNLDKTLKIVEELKEFICFKDGDRIAMFIAEGGVECLESRKPELIQCSNSSLFSRIPTTMSVEALPLFIFTDQECSDFDKIRKCFNEELEKCKDSTPANIVDAFFKFLKKHLPCDNVLATEKAGLVDGRNSSPFVTSSLLIIGLALLFSKIS